MNGARHYRLSENILKDIVDGTIPADAVPVQVEVAQTHAILALVAATVGVMGRSVAHAYEWDEVTRPHDPLPAPSPTRRQAGGGP